MTLGSILLGTKSKESSSYKEDPSEGYECYPEHTKDLSSDMFRLRLRLTSDRRLHNRR